MRLGEMFCRLLPSSRLRKPNNRQSRKPLDTPQSEGNMNGTSLHDVITVLATVFFMGAGLISLAFETKKWQIAALLIFASIIFSRIKGARTDIIQELDDIKARLEQMEAPR